MDPSPSTRFRHNLTFSSTLLDQIYQSIDQQSQPTVCTQTTRKKQSSFVEHDPGNLTSRLVKDHEHRDCLYHKFMQNKAYDKPVLGRSYTSSSGFSSSKPKHDNFNIKREKDNSRGTDNEDGKFVNTKTKALKMYNHLKKMKQPISPRLSSFFNSLFITRNNKKPNSKSTCSSASSCSRACLSDTTSSRTKFSNEINKSVRFYPGSKSLTGKSVEMHISEQENTRVSKAGNKKKVEWESDSVTNIEDEYEHESNDGESDSSSDLFELKNLSPVRICRYQEELPIYATTNLHTNRAIANSNLM